MRKGRGFLALMALIGVLGSTVPFRLEGATQKRRRHKPVPAPRVSPTPTPVPLQRAAGSCLRYEPNQYVIVAEVGQAGRVFRIDGETVIRMLGLRTGSRVRILYEDSPEGPVARRILPGPELPPK